MRPTTKLLLTALAACCALPSVAATQGKGGGDRVVNVYNWSDYIEPGVIEGFTKTTGIRVRYDTFDSNDFLEAKLLAGRSGYDPHRGRR